ncbi:RnfABCDGE type electron transport complex subunit D [Cyanobacterium aponinum UTEX 3221]|uniref:RnfABCDGE type electron transport complex subunit D n=1 Tax=Cyanobacterium aponinum TaxID=379064 RepID=UPI002B4C21E4|nr:RnfABCDGE type electron transport complex subunit D [Cyanobacterium aponinum]WRL40120.1 RnfABCDGE type electron transport complex subunit D [Cyanobacterium aponinum UTEX 3221]
MKVFQDARDYQILFLSLFLSLGVVNRDWTLSPIRVVLIIIACLLVQFLCESLTHYQQNFNILINKDYNEKILESISFQGWKSALITSLGLSLLLRANDISTLVIASAIAITSKFIFKYHNKHFFNPANFGIIGVLLLTNDGWISPGQWGSDWLYLGLFLATGAMVLKKVGRWETTAVFLSTYGILEAIYNYYLGWNFEVLLHQLMTGSLLVFAFFMLSDPRSIPDGKNGRIIWAIAIAFLGFILGNLFFINNGVFWSLFIISPLTILFDLIWKGNRFRWRYSINS